eukprot:4728458-Lingulodinium_polyedra.AAC.1
MDLKCGQFHLGKAKTSATAYELPGTRRTQQMAFRSCSSVRRSGSASCATYDKVVTARML